jgi:lysophospholipase L1-like esterase
MPRHKGFWGGTRGNLALMLVVLGLCAVGLEFACRVLPVSDSMGWNRTLPLAERAKRFDTSAPMKIVALGDSFAEWRAGEGVNMFDLLQVDLSPQGGKILNLGQAGTDVIDYIASYHRYVHFTPDVIILCLTLGNDVYDYSEKVTVTAGELGPEAPQSGLKAFIKKHSVVVNFLFRLSKQYLPVMQAGSFDQDVRSLQKKAGLTEAQVQSRLARLDPKIIKLARSDAVNPWVPAIGAISPEFYQELYRESSPRGRAQAEDTLRLIRDFCAAEKVKNFLVVLLPESLQVSERYDDFFKRCGYDLDNFPLPERRGLIRYLQRRLGDFGIMSLDTTPALEKVYPAYIPLDTHPNSRGHKAIAEAMAQYIRKHFLVKPSDTRKAGAG